MVSSTYIGYVQTLMNYQWNYFWNISANYSSFTNSSGNSVSIGNAVILSYSGALLAFLLSVIGAYDNSGKTIQQVEDNIDDFIKHWGKGNYEDVMQLAEENE